jgi:hypothetical protein
MGHLPLRRSSAGVARDAGLTGLHKHSAAPPGHPAWYAAHRVAQGPSAPTGTTETPSARR